MLAQAQDTVSVYFAFGSARIEPAQVQALQGIEQLAAQLPTDSVHFVGYTDSVGNMEANLRLSEKRAKAVQRLCKTFWQGKPPTRIFARGEARKSPEWKNRRVDVVLFSAEANQPLADDTSNAELPHLSPADGAVSQGQQPLCFTVNWSLIHRCHITQSGRRKKSKVHLSLQPEHYLPSDQCYYGVFRADSTLQIKTLRWSMRTTGKLWWRKTRYTATLPADSYDRFKLFSFYEPPCKACHEPFQTTPFVTNADSCVRVAWFVMRNMQARFRWVPRKYINVRVPAEYIQPDKQYLYGCELQKTLDWYSRKGKRKARYMYAKVPMKSARYMYNISSVEQCCAEVPGKSMCGEPQIGIINCKRLDKVATVAAEAGGFYANKSLAGFAGAGVRVASGMQDVQLTGGFTSDLAPYTALRTRWYFLPFPYSALNPFKLWHEPGTGSDADRYAALFLAGEASGVFQPRKHTLNTFAGLGLAAVGANGSDWLPLVYAQVGAGTTTGDAGTQLAFPVVSVGATFTLAKIYQWPQL